MCTLKSRAQMDALNRAFVFSRLNPAFVASPIDFNRASFLMNADGAQLLSAQYYFRNKYMGIGAFGERDEWQVAHAGLSWAVHTIFLNAIDLQAGVQGEFTRDRYGNNYAAVRYGVLFYYGAKKKSFLGVHLRQQFQGPAMFRNSYGVQAGAAVWRFSRRGVLRAFATCDFNGYQLYDLTIQPMVFIKNMSAGIGYKMQSYSSSAALLRAGYRWKKLNTSLVWALSKNTFNGYTNQRLELSLQYNLP